MVYSDFEDRAGTATDIAILGIPVGTDMDPFRRKARVFLRPHENDIAVLKVLPWPGSSLAAREVIE